MLIYVDTSDVRDGALAELKWAIEELAAYIGNAQRRMLAYSAFFSDDGRRMTVVHLHPDAASLDRKASLLGGNGVAVHALHAGFSRVDRQ